MRSLLEIYVADHLAGSVGGIAFARRCARNNRGTPTGAAVAEVASQIEEDARTLSEIAAELGVRRSRPRELIVVAGERVGRLKLNGRLRRYSPLSRVVELEALRAAIDLKRSLWRALAASPHAPKLARFDLAMLIDRATTQREILVDHHRQAASIAL